MERGIQQADDDRTVGHNSEDLGEIIDLQLADFGQCLEKFLNIAGEPFRFQRFCDSFWIVPALSLGRFSVQ